MWKLPKLTLVFQLFIRILEGIVALFIIRIVFNLVQILLILLFFVLLDYNGITISGQSVRKLALLVMA